ncbi:hypothetical protein N0V83_005570 [Neocucurbitaria cava]|uniref:Glycine zipper 2TM domain-containing protein n=1 Tax=Neocucurbitaria cava TaxID=798079 RepID=A0A9W9CM76_9PLEO|nr:hypothetical protein N0V83_005570 [Neocucurbitaria cava]
MAAQDYYLGSQAAQELPGHAPPNLYPQPQYPQPPPQPYAQQNYNASNYTNTPPPSYSLHPQQSTPQQQLQAYDPQQQYPAKVPQALGAPYPQTPPPAQYYPPPPQQKNSYLGAPLQPIRSHSQPARVRFADQESDRSTDLGSESDSDNSPQRRRRHHRHRSSNDRDRDLDYSVRERERGHRHSSSKIDKESHKNRDTFLGAGAGTILGDAIFPGLGTAAGLLLGGYGGRKYAERSKSEDSLRHHRHRDAFRDGKEEGRQEREYRRRKEEYDDSDSDYKRSSKGHRRRPGENGWDAETATYKSGWAVR